MFTTGNGSTAYRGKKQKQKTHPYHITGKALNFTQNGHATQIGKYDISQKIVGEIF